jgi:hypothetical protein
MANAFGIQTTSDLVEAVKRRGFIPDAQNALDDNDIIKFLNEELYDSLVPLILQYHEEYLVYIKSLLIIPSVSSYKIPYRALGRKIRDIKYQDNNGNLFPMTRILPEDRNYFQETGFNPYKSFYFQGDEIVLIPGVGELPVGNFIIQFFMRPNTLVLEKRSCQIINIDSATGVISVDKIPTNITVGSTIDFIEYLPGNKLKAYDISVLGVDNVAKTITVDATSYPDPSNPHGPNITYLDKLSMDDYVNTAGESIVPQVPSELHSLLAERGAARCLASLGQSENLQNSNAKIAELEKKSGSLIDNRSEGTPMKVNNLGGILRQSKISKRRFYF